MFKNLWPRFACWFCTAAVVPCVKLGVGNVACGAIGATGSIVVGTDPVWALGFIILSIVLVIISGLWPNSIACKSLLISSKKELLHY